jgi:hypothetical protein
METAERCLKKKNHSENLIEERRKQQRTFSIRKRSKYFIGSKQLRTF